MAGAAALSDDASHEDADGGAPFYSILGDGGTVAKIGNDEYNSLLDAVNAAKDNEIITLLENVEIVTPDANQRTFIIDGRAVVLDLNGKTLESTRGDSNKQDMSLFAIENGGSLTVKDSSGDKSGKIDAAWYAIRISNGSFTLESGTIQSEDATVSTTNDSVYGHIAIEGGKLFGKKAAITLNTRGQINVTGGAIEAGPDLKSGVIILSNSSSGRGPAVLNMTGGKVTTLSDKSNKWAIYASAENTEANIGGGEICGSSTLIRADYDGRVNITGGKLTGSCTTVIQVEVGTLTISGGELTNNNSTNWGPSVITTYGKKPSSVAISGGTFENAGKPAKPVIFREHPDVGSFVISGGTFSSDPSDYVDKSKNNIELENGLYKVKDGPTKYTVTWRNWNNSVLSSSEVAHGDTPAYPGDAPTREATAQYTFDFSGWSPDLAPADRGITYKAQFAETIRTYTVTVVAGKYGTVDGNSVEADYGTSISVGGSKLTVGETAFTATPNEADAQYTYAFDKWTPAVGDDTTVTGDVTYTANFSATVNKYTVTFDSDGGSVVASAIVEYGSKAAEPPAPEKTGHTFIGWRLGETEYDFNDPVIKDLGLVASWSIDSYTVTLAFGNGDENRAITLDYGAEMPAVGNPEKTGHTFVRWEPEIPAKMPAGDMVINAEWNVNQYTVTFTDDGRQDFVVPPQDYGTTLTAPAWTKDGYGLSWGPDFDGKVPADDTTYKAVWTAKEYKVVFHTVDNYYSQTFTFDAPAELRSAGTRAGYAFDGWAATDGGPVRYSDGQEICVRPYAERIDLYAIWEAETYAVSAAPAENGTVGVSPSAECGSTVTVTLSPAEGYVVASLSAEPEVEFSGDGDVRTFAMPASDVIITATFAKSLSTVTWTDWNGEILETDGDVPYGEMPVYNGAKPVRESTAEFDYAFSGWSPEISAVAGDVTYTAVYAETLRTYTVTWKDGDVILNAEKDVPYGVAVAWKGASAPAREPTAEFEYTFTGWEPALAEGMTVAGDMEFLAQFESVKRSYEIAFVVDGIETVQNAEYGATPAFDGVPAKDADVQYTYAFDGWEPEIAAVSGPATYTAVFSETLRTYAVTWKDWNGTVLETDEAVPYGEMPTFDGAIPVREPTAEFSYAFSGWSPEISAVAADAEYTAAYAETLRTYTVTWKDGDAVLATEEGVPYGTTVAWKGESVPVRESTAEFEYAFAGWNPAVDEGTVVTGDMEFLAQFESVKRSYEIAFVVDGTETVVKTVEYGATPAYDGAPAKEADAQYTYAFDGWEPEIVAVSGPATYTAVFKQTFNTYVVTWKNWNGTVLETDDAVPYGEVPMFDGAIPVREPTVEFTYTFDKWTPNVVAVAGDAEYAAVYIEISASAPEIASIEISVLPEKIAYEIGERFDPAGLAVVGVYADGQRRMLSSSEYTVDAPVLCKPGDFTVAVSYEGLSAEFTVSVAAPEPAHDVTENDDGSTTTVGIEVEESEGGTIVVRTEATEHPDGTKTEARSETAYAPDGSVTETSATSSVSADGATSETSETVRTDASGAEVGRETSVKSSETVKDAAGAAVATVTVESVTRTVGGASESAERVAFEAADGGIGTVVESSDGKAKAVTTISVDGMVGADIVSGAVAQADDALDRLLSLPKSVERTVAVETGAGTSAAFAPGAVRAVAGSGAGLEVSGGGGSVGMGVAICEKLASKAEARIEIVLTHNDDAAVNEVQRDVVGDRHFIDLSALVDGVKVHDLGGTAVVEFPYELKEGELAENMAIFYIDDSGAKELVDSVYRDGRFTMETDHFSVFVVENTAAASEPEDEGGDGGSTLLYAGVAAAAVLILVLAVFLLRRRA